MDKSRQEKSANESVFPKIKTMDTTLSPITNLSQGFSCLSATNSITPCRKISYSDWSPAFNLEHQISFGDSPFSDDSPSLQEGILRPIQAINYSKGERFCKPLKNVAKDNKENVIENSEICDLIKSKQSLLFMENSEEDVLDEFPKTSQESGFIDSRSFTSRSNSVPSIRSSVFTDEELDDDDSLFAVDKLVEDDGSSEVLSSSMTQLIHSPLINSYDFKVNTSSESQNENKPLRRCSSMVIQSKERACSFTESIKFTTVIKEDEATGKETKSNFKCTFKRPDPIDHVLTPLQNKRRKSSPVVTIPSSSRLINKSPLVRCYSETAATIMRAVQRSVQNPDLIGDCSKPFALSLIEGRHQDLKSISGETLVKLIKGEYADSIKDFVIVDCRYPYEYLSGHIKGARNIYTKDDIYSNFLLSTKLPANNEDRSVIIFHCEFSSERAPKLLRFLRNKDRELNEDLYPHLYHPEIYILEGGYRAFFQNHRKFCEPQEYLPMLHKDHSEDLKEYQKGGKNKTWGKLRVVQNRGSKSLKFDSH